MPKYHIDEVYAKSTVYPFILTYKNGYAADSIAVNSCGIFEDTRSGEKTVVSEANKFIYCGNEVEDDTHKNVILVRNKKTGMVRLIEVGQVNMAQLTKADKNSSELEESGYLDLSRKFGSKKQKKKVELKEKHKVNESTVSEQMLNTTENVASDTLDYSGYNKPDTDDFYIPVINRQASKVQDVYLLSNILSEELFDKIYCEIEGKDLMSNLHPIVKDILLSDSHLEPKHAVLALYASTALTLYSLIGRDISKKNFVACPISATLNQICLDIFTVTTKGKRNRPLPYKDKALCYAMVLILLINNYKFNLNILLNHIKLSASTIANKVRVTGATIINDEYRKIVHLKLPLMSAKIGRRKSAKF